MPTLDDKHDRLDSVPKSFVKSMEGVQSKVSKEIEDLLSNLEMKDGQILLSEKNMALIENINQRLKNLIFDEAYEKNLTNFLGEFKKQAELNNAYFHSIVPDFEPSKLYESVLKNTQKNALSLLNEDAFKVSY
jgi:predicted outer membrane protein